MLCRSKVRNTSHGPCILLLCLVILPLVVASIILSHMPSGCCGNRHCAAVGLAGGISDLLAMISLPNALEQRQLCSNACELLRRMAAANQHSRLGHAQLPPPRCPAALSFSALPELTHSHSLVDFAATERPSLKREGWAH